MFFVLSGPEAPQDYGIQETFWTPLSSAPPISVSAVVPLPVAHYVLFMFPCSLVLLWPFTHLFLGLTPSHTLYPFLQF